MLVAPLCVAGRAALVDWGVAVAGDIRPGDFIASGSDRQADGIVGLIIKADRQHCAGEVDINCKKSTLLKRLMRKSIVK